MKTLAVSLLSLFASLFAVKAAAQTSYRFENVSRSVLVRSAGHEQRAAKGSEARGGDQVETGWFASALIASPGHQAKFELFSATVVTLADGTPGVVLSLERGRIRAAFDKITGNEPRIVKTPGALLAVRGTEFDVRVDRGGNTTVDVFEGVVEIQSPLRPEPLFVRGGEAATFGRERPPQSGPIPEERRRDRNPDGARDGSRDGDRRNRPEGEQRPPRGGSDRSPQSPPQKPPQKPPASF